jgi:hypothetical protein
MVLLVGEKGRQIANKSELLELGSANAAPRLCKLGKQKRSYSWEPI